MTSERELICPVHTNIQIPTFIPIRKIIYFRINLAVPNTKTTMTRLCLVYQWESKLEGFVAMSNEGSILLIPWRSSYPTLNHRRSRVMGMSANTNIYLKRYLRHRSLLTIFSERAWQPMIPGMPHYSYRNSFGMSPSTRFVAGL